MSEKPQFDVQREIDRRIRHERLDEPPASKGLLLVTAALAAAALAAAVCEDQSQKEKESHPTHQVEGVN